MLGMSSGDEGCDEGAEAGALGTPGLRRAAYGAATCVRVIAPWVRFTAPPLAALSTEAPNGTLIVQVTVMVEAVPAFELTL